MQLDYRSASLVIEIKRKIGLWKCDDTSEHFKPSKRGDYCMYEYHML
jgi:hypothetical protein